MTDHREARPTGCLSDDARDLLELIRAIRFEGRDIDPVIRRNDLDDRLGRARGNGATLRALEELDSIGDLANVTRSGLDREPVSFTLAQP